jgi:hypothetical protein
MIPGVRSVRLQADREVRLIESYPFSGSEVYALGDILAAVGELRMVSRSG